MRLLLLLPLLTLSPIDLLDLSKWSQDWKGTCESKKIKSNRKRHPPAGTRDLHPAFGRWRLHKMTTEKTESWPEQHPVDQNTMHLPDENISEWLLTNGKNNYTNVEFLEAWNKSINTGGHFDLQKRAELDQQFPILCCIVFFFF